MKVKHTQHKSIRSPIKVGRSCFDIGELPFPQISDLRPYQLKIFDMLCRGKTLHVTKSRQIGMTTVAVIYAGLKIQQEGVRPNILAMGSKMEKHIEHMITDRVGNESWKYMPVGWSMLDESEWIHELKFRGVDIKDQVFSYSSVHYGGVCDFLTSRFVNDPTSEYRLITYKDAFPGTTDEEIDQLKLYMGSVGFNKDMMCKLHHEEKI